MLKYYLETLENLPLGIFIADQKGTIEFANENLERIFGYPQGGLQRQPVSVLIPKANELPHNTYLDRFFSSPSTRQMGSGEDIKGVKMDGSLIPLEIGLHPIESPVATLVLATVIDLTARKRQFQDEALRKTLATATHEISQPLMGLAGITDLLLKFEKLSPELKKNLTLIRESTTEITRIVDRMRSTKVFQTKAYVDDVEIADFDTQENFDYCR